MKLETTECNAAVFTALVVTINLLFVSICNYYSFKDLAYILYRQLI